MDLIAGARPNFMKIAPIIKEFNRLGRPDFTFRLVHTGQHYDENLSDTFFRQLNIPQPDINLRVGSGTQAQQTGSIMERYEEVLLTHPSDACLVVGDVNSTMACAITAQKLRIPVGHVEAGIRSSDWSMPEEINRLVTDSISNWFFTTSETANKNLIKSGIEKDRIFFVGNTMIDTLIENIAKLKKPRFFEELNLISGEYFVVTLHRPSNVDIEVTIKDLLQALSKAARGLPIIFPVHPRTAKSLNNMSKLPYNILLVEPQPYLEFNFLVKNSKAVITDSGGITEESTVLGIPCMTLRNNTERPETVMIGTNELLGTNPSAIMPAFEKLFSGNWKKGEIPELWDGGASARIVSHLEKLLCI